MGLTSRQKRPLDRKGGKQRDARLFVIATEGEKTEKQYFEYFGRKDSRVQIIVLETKGGFSAPQYILKRMKEFVRDKELWADDERWVVFDKDKWPDAQLSQVASESRHCRFNLAVSNPCFELWLFIHLGDVQAEMDGKPCNFFDSEIRRILGRFDPSHIDLAAFEPRIDAAVLRGSRLDKNSTERWPSQMGTRVYKVVQSILAKLQNTIPY